MASEALQGLIAAAEDLQDCAPALKNLETAFQRIDMSSFVTNAALSLPQLNGAVPDHQGILEEAK